MWFSHKKYDQDTKNVIKQIWLMCKNAIMVMEREICHLSTKSITKIQKTYSKYKCTKNM